MKKLKLQTQISIDGFMGGPNGEMDFMTWQWSDDLKNKVTELTNSVDHIVMGKSFAQGFIPYWAEVAADTNNPEQESGAAFNGMKKTLFSLDPQAGFKVPSDWNNTQFSPLALKEGIEELKKEEGDKDLIAYGGSSFVSSLIELDLIDEYYLFLNPVVIGKGLPLFHKLQTNRKTGSIQAQSYDCGITLIRFDALR